MSATHHALQSKIEKRIEEIELLPDSVDKTMLRHFLKATRYIVLYIDAVHHSLDQLEKDVHEFIGLRKRWVAVWEANGMEYAPDRMIAWEDELDLMQGTIMRSVEELDEGERIANMRSMSNPVLACLAPTSFAAESASLWAEANDALDGLQRRLEDYLSLVVSGILQRCPTIPDAAGQSRKPPMVRVHGGGAGRRRRPLVIGGESGRSRVQRSSD